MCTLNQFVCGWREIGRKGGGRGDFENTPFSHYTPGAKERIGKNWGEAD